MTNKQSPVKQFTRGGQTFLHNFRMFGQIAERALCSVLMVCVLLSAFLMYVNTTAYERYVVKEWLVAQAIVPFDNTVTQEFKLPHEKHIKIHSQELLTDPAIEQIIAHVNHRLFSSVMISLGLSILLLWALSEWLKWRGRTQMQEKHVRGDRLVERAELIRSVKKANRHFSPFKLHQVPLPQRAEYANFFLHGSVGTGKSETIKHLLDQIRRQGDRAIIFDKGCDFIRYFYRYEQDVLLNPLDERGAGWDLWTDCEHPAHFDALAAALIPMPAGAGADPFWVNAARTIFAASAFEMRKDPERSTLKLLKVILTAELDKISDLLRGTEAESLVSDKIGKTAISIKSVLATYLKSLKFLRAKESTFSLRRWIQDDTQSNWVFITSKSDIHETLKPLISGWLDIAANALTSLEPSTERRIWVILDEVPSLNQLPYLPSAVSEGRKFGGAFVLGLQSIAQLRKLYGRDGAEELSGLCNTRVFYRTPTSETASWVSKELGQAEIEEMRESSSYGENAMRAGISVSQQTVQRYIVNYSEIMMLPDLSCYLRLPGEYPVAKLALSYVPRRVKTTAFIASPSSSDEDTEVVDELLAQYEAQTPLISEGKNKAAPKTKATKPRKKRTPKPAQVLMPPGMEDWAQGIEG